MHRWAECKPLAVDSGTLQAFANWLANLIVSCRCGGSPELMSIWNERQQDSSPPPLPATQAELLETYLTQGFGTPDRPASLEHLHGTVAEYLWYGVKLEWAGFDRSIERIDEPSWAVTDPGADGLVVYRDRLRQLAFTLWESRQHEATASSVRDSVNDKCRQLEARAVAYLARASKIGQQINDNDELALLYGKMAEMWLDGERGAAAGVHVAASGNQDGTHSFGGMPNYFEAFAQSDQREGLLITFDDFPAFALLVREAIWKGL